MSFPLFPVRLYTDINKGKNAKKKPPKKQPQQQQQQQQQQKTPNHG